MKICNVKECKHHTEGDNCTKGMITMKRIEIDGIIYAVCLQFYRKQKSAQMHQRVLDYIKNNEGKCSCGLFASFVGPNYDQLKDECLATIRNLKANGLVKETVIDICSYLSLVETDD